MASRTAAALRWSVGSVSVATWRRCGPLQTLAQFFASQAFIGQLAGGAGGTKQFSATQTTLKKIHQQQVHTVIVESGEAQGIANFQKGAEASCGLPLRLGQERLHLLRRHPGFENPREGAPEFLHGGSA